MKKSQKSTLRNAVTIDGPAGAGKSCVARRVADAKGFLYVDTGAMYRAIALRALRLKIDMQDPGSVADTANAARILFNDSGTRIFLDGGDVSRLIRMPDVTECVKHVACVPAVRDLIVNKLRVFAENQPVVMEGRDISTVVLPRAKWKFFLTASIETRAKRRHAEMLEAGRDVSLQRIYDDIARRDDSDYEVGPMKEARDRALNGDGIFYLDTSDMNPTQVVAAMLKEMEN